MNIKRMLLTGLLVPVFAIVVILSVLDLLERFDVIDHGYFTTAVNAFQTSVPIWFIPAYWVLATIVFSILFGKGREGNIKTTVFGVVTGALMAYFLIEKFGFDQVIHYPNKPILYAAITSSTVILWKYAQPSAAKTFS